MSAIASISVLVLGLVAGFLAMRAFGRAGLSRIVHEWEQGLLYIDGRFVRVLAPGRYRTFGFAQRTIVTLPSQPRLEAVPSVDVVSAERLSYRLSALATYRITDPRRAHEREYRAQMRLCVTEGLVRLAAARSLEVVLAERANLGETLFPLIVQPDCGCTIESVLVSAVTMPPELRRLYAEIERARLDGQAALERARGEQAALRSLANSARLLKGNPELMNLRLLQALSASGGKGGATLVLGRDALAGPLADARTAADQES